MHIAKLTQIILLKVVNDVFSRITIFKLLALLFRILSRRVILLECFHELVIPKNKVSVAVEIAHGKLMLLRSKAFGRKDYNVVEMF